MTGSVRAFAALILMVALSACRTAYYGTLEAFGVHKRDILVNQIEDARDAQEEAKDQFASALEQFSSVVDFDGGDLEKTYDKLSRELERSESRAGAVRNTIDDVEGVADALFREWETELEDYSDPNLRRQSQRQLADTRSRYETLIASMHRAESRIEPVLDVFRDQVLFLKHNLNATAIASIQNELSAVENDVAGLIREMESSIAEAEEFIRAMDAPG